MTYAGSAAGLRGSSLHSSLLFPDHLSEAPSELAHMRFGSTAFVLLSCPHLSCLSQVKGKLGQSTVSRNAGRSLISRKTLVPRSQRSSLPQFLGLRMLRRVPSCPTHSPCGPTVSFTSWRCRLGVRTAAMKHSMMRSSLSPESLQPVMIIHRRHANTVQPTLDFACTH